MILAHKVVNPVSPNLVLKLEESRIILKLNFINPLSQIYVFGCKQLLKKSNSKKELIQ